MYSCGVMSLSINSRRYLRTYLGALITFALGATFLGLELREFSSMIAIGATPQRSAFLSAFFTLVGCHGLHVALGLIWLIVMMVQVAVFGLATRVQHRLLCFSLFWHALDIVWVGVFTVVYRMGVSPCPKLDTNAHPETGRAARWTHRLHPSFSSTRSACFWRFFSQPHRSGLQTSRCFGQAAYSSGSRSSPLPRWAFTWCFSCI